MRGTLPTLALLLLPLLLPGGATAQAVEGRLREEGSGAPIDGAVVVLLDAAGGEHAAALTDGAGRYLLRAPVAGSYRLRAERIGYRATLSPALALTVADTLTHDLTAPAAAIRLDGIAVAAERRCVRRPAEGMLAATLWEEARKALSAAALTQAQQLVRFRVRRHERRLDPQTLRVRGEASEVRTLWGSSPFSSLPADELAREGYVRDDGDGLIYYAPDADALLSDAFLDGHCFRVRRVGEGPEGRVGLSFEPVRARGRRDIEGTLWLDPATAELRYVEFGYTGVPGHRAGVPGGRVEYERLPGGAWIVRRWWIRMPELGRNARGRIALLSVKQVGGEVDEIVDGGGGRIADEDLPRLAGTVFDSVAGRPLAGATIYLSGTSRTAVTGADGTFRLDAPAGDYAVGFLHARLDSLGIVAPRLRISLGPEGMSGLELAVPSLTSVLAAPCLERPREPETAVIAGVVADASTGSGLPGATVELRWRDAVHGAERTLSARTDPHGRYRFCAAPVGVPVRVGARILDRDAPGTTARPDGTTPLRVDLRLPLSRRPPPDPLRRRTLGPGAPATLEGRVVDSRTGEPVAGALLALDGIESSATTGTDGRFRMPGLRADAYLLVVRREGYVELRRVVRIEAGGNVLEVEMR